MKVRALRGVCIGVERNLVVGEINDDLDTATLNFLIAIKAIEEVIDAPEPEPEPEPTAKAKKS